MSNATERHSSIDMNAEQIKGEVRYLNLSDKIEIYRWLDGEIGDGLRRSLAIRQEIEQKWKASSPRRAEYTASRP